MNKKAVTGITGFILFVFGMNLTIISPLLSEIGDTFGISNMGQLGFLFTANFLGFIIFTIFGGILSERFGKAPVLKISLIIFSIALFIFPLSNSFMMACWVIFFIGASGGVIESMGSSYMVDINEENHGFYVNLVHVFLGIGALLGPLAAGFIISSGIGWQICYFIVGGIAALCTILFFLVKKPPVKGVEKIDWSLMGGFFKNKHFLLVCLCMFLYTGAEVGTWGWLATFLKSEMGFDANQSSIAVGVFWLAMTIGRLIFGSLSLKFKLKNLIIALSVFSALTTALPIFVSNEIGLWIIIAAIGVSYSSIWPFITAFGSEVVPGNTGLSFSIMITAGGVGITVVPLLMGIIGENSTLQGSLILPAVLLLGVALFFIPLKHRKKVEM